MRAIEIKLRASFSEGMEKGESIAVAEHAARWKRMDE